MQFTLLHSHSRSPEMLAGTVFSLLFYCTKPYSGLEQSFTRSSKCSRFVLCGGPPTSASGFRKFVSSCETLVSGRHLHALDNPASTQLAEEVEVFAH